MSKRIGGVKRMADLDVIPDEVVIHDTTTSVDCGLWVGDYPNDYN
jgi:hypothetical protein